MQMTQQEVRQIQEKLEDKHFIISKNTGISIGLLLVLIPFLVGAGLWWANNQRESQVVEEIKSFVEDQRIINQMITTQAEANTKAIQGIIQREEQSRWLYAMEKMRYYMTQVEGQPVDPERVKEIFDQTREGKY